MRISAPSGGGLFLAPVLSLTLAACATPPWIEPMLTGPEARLLARTVGAAMWLETDAPATEDTGGAGGVMETVRGCPVADWSAGVEDAYDEAQWACLLTLREGWEIQQRFTCDRALQPDGENWRASGTVKNADGCGRNETPVGADNRLNGPFSIAKWSLDLRDVTWSSSRGFPTGGSVVVTSGLPSRLSGNVDDPKSDGQVYTLQFIGGPDLHNVLVTNETTTEPIEEKL